MGVIRASSTVGAFTLFSRFSGYIRECAMVFCLGAGVCSDAFMVALKIANTFRRIFAEGAFNASFLPRFSRVLNQNGKKEANVVLSEIFSVLILILVSFSVVMIVFFPHILMVLVSGFDRLSEKFGLTVVLGRICFPYLIFISITSFFGGVLNTINKFALPAAIHSLLSIFVAVGLMTCHWLNLSDTFAVLVASVCVILSGIVQSYWLFKSVQQHGFAVSFRLNCWSRRVKDIMKNMIPGIIGTGVWQLNLLIDTTISSYLPTGTITCVNLADRLNQLPLGTLGIALSTALLPLLSKLISTGKYEEARQELEKGLLFAFFLTFFATSVLMALSEPSASVAFQRGMFGEEQVKITASATVGFAIGLPAYVLSKVFSSVYFASGNTVSPVIFGMVSVVFNVIFLLLLVPFFKYFGLAAATSLAAISNAIMLISFSNKKLQINFTKNFCLKIFSQLIAALVTYFSLKGLVNLYWDADLGAKAIKWLIYLGFLCTAMIVFFITTTICLQLTNQTQWKLWK